MKHLKKFNENKEEGLDIEYIKHCFSDLIDDEICDVEFHEMSDFNSVLIQVGINRVIKGMEKSDSDYEYDINMDHLQENIDRMSYVSKRIVSGIKNLQEEYPNYNIKCTYNKVNIKRKPDMDDFIDLKIELK